MREVNGIDAGLNSKTKPNLRTPQGSKRQPDAHAGGSTGRALVPRSKQAPEPDPSLRTAGCLDRGDYVRLRSPDSRDALDRREHRLRERLLVGNLDEREDVRLPPARMGLLHATHATQGRDDLLVLPGLDETRT
jgi:hypothetical protein